MTNRELIDRYPFIQLDKDTKDTTWLDFMPTGWRVSFGELLCEDIKQIYDRHGIDSRDMEIFDIKEKWGALRVNFTTDFRVYHEVDDVIDAYSALSTRICIVCGKPDVPFITKGWIYPCCEDCFRGDKEAYQKIISKESKMPTSSTWMLESGKKITKDLTSFARRIRDNYKEGDWDE